MQLYNQDAAAVRLCKRSGNDPGAGLATALVFSCRLGRSSVRICPEAPFRAAAALARHASFMSDSGDTMGSLLDSGPVVEPPDDPEGLEAPRVAIDIHPTADRDELAGQFAALLAAHAAETKKLESRIETLEALRMTEKMEEAASSAAQAAAAAATSAEAAAKLIETSEGAVQCAAEVLTATREAMTAFGSDGNIQSLLSDHCVSAATAAKASVLQCLDDAREEALDFVEEQAAAVEQKAAAGKRGTKKR